MKALGVALAACCAGVFWPSVAHADPIGANAGATIVLTLAPGWQALDGDGDADDGTFTAQAGLDHSVHFAATGTIDVFNDDHASLGSVVDVQGLATQTSNRITLALHTANTDGDMDRDDGSAPAMPQDPSAAPLVPHAPAADPPADPPADPTPGGGLQTSATPEPASMLLLATGLAGLVFFRRQLFS